jgi:hypothetical protein
MPETQADFLKQFPSTPPTKGAKPYSKTGGHKAAECYQCLNRGKPLPDVCFLPMRHPPITVVESEREWTYEEEEAWIDHCAALFGITRPTDPFEHLEWPRK